MNEHVEKVEGETVALILHRLIHQQEKHESHEIRLAVYGIHTHGGASSRAVANPRSLLPDPAVHRRCSNQLQPTPFNPSSNLPSQAGFHLPFCLSAQSLVPSWRDQAEGGVTIRDGVPFERPEKEAQRDLGTTVRAGETE